MKKVEDHILIKQLKNGNHQAFNQLYIKYFPKLYGFSLKMTNSKEDAEEIVQEVFVKVWEMKSNLDPARSFSSLLFTIGKHKIYNKARHRVYDIQYLNYFKENGHDAEDLTANEIFFEETNLILEKAIDQLPEKRRAIFKLSRFDGLSNKEIANKMNTSLSNIENHINKALKSIKGQLSENEILLWLIFLTQLISLA